MAASCLSTDLVSRDVFSRWEKELFTLPEMVFPAAALRIRNPQSGISLDFTARDALECLKGQAASAELPYADKWKDKGGMETATFGKIKVQEYNYDWTYATRYAGTVQKTGETEPPQVTAAAEGIPVEMLKRPEKILFYDEIILFEDELADNGTCKLSVKLRVMPSCWFVLMRLYLRVDHVMVRIIDTRFFHAFGSNKVIRERKVLQEGFQTLAQATGDIKDEEGKTGAFADGNLIVQHLPVTECETIEQFDI